MIQFAIEIEIKGGGESPERQVWRHTEAVPPGTIVRIFAGKNRPLSSGSCDWYREDLDYQVVTDNADTANPWKKLFESLGGEIYGHQAKN